MSNYQKIIKSAEAGDVEAQMELSLAYFSGDVNGKSEFGEALTWMERAANSGSVKAQFAAAKMYEQLGITGTAIKWLEKAANNGAKLAEAELSQYYYSGVHVAKDEEKAYMYAKRAFQKGEETLAPLVLGLLYLSGNVVESDGLQAYKMFKLSALNGNETARGFVKRMQEDVPELRNM